MQSDKTRAAVQKRSVNAEVHHCCAQAMTPIKIAIALAAIAILTWNSRSQ